MGRGYFGLGRRGFLPGGDRVELLPPGTPVITSLEPLLRETFTLLTQRVLKENKDFRIYNEGDTQSSHNATDRPDFSIDYWVLSDTPRLSDGVLLVMPSGIDVDLKEKMAVIERGGWWIIGPPYHCIEWSKTPSRRTFHLFPDLPAEIRLKIWKLALPDPRLVGIRFWNQIKFLWSLGDFHSTENEGFGKQHLLTCHESADMFMESYQRMPPPQPLSTWEHRPVRCLDSSWYSQKRDTLYVDNTIMREAERAGFSFDVSWVECIAMVTAPEHHGQKAIWITALSLCPGLKSLTVVPWGDTKRYEAMRLVIIEESLEHSGWVYEDGAPIPIGRLRSTDVEVASSRQKCLDIAHLFRRTHSEMVADNPQNWKGFKFRIACIGNKVSKSVGNRRVQWIFPRVKQDYYVTYYTWREDPVENDYFFCQALGYAVRRNDKTDLENVYEGIERLLK